jgi:hypothetical protein
MLLVSQSRSVGLALNALNMDTVMGGHAFHGITEP